MEAIIRYLSDIVSFFEMIVNSFIYFMSFLFNIPNYIGTVLGITPTWLFIPVYICYVVLMIKAICSIVGSVH